MAFRNRFPASRCGSWYQYLSPDEPLFFVPGINPINPLLVVIGRQSVRPPTARYSRRVHVEDHLPMLPGHAAHLQPGVAGIPVRPKQLPVTNITHQLTSRATVNDIIVEFTHSLFTTKIYYTHFNRTEIF